MPLIGYKDRDGYTLSFDEIDSLKDEELVARFGHPPPIVKMLTERPREPYPDDVVAVTELADDIRHAILRRKRPYAEHAEAQFWKVVGTGIHTAVWLAAGGKAMLEAIAKEVTPEEARRPEIPHSVAEAINEFLKQTEGQEERADVMIDGVNVRTRADWKHDGQQGIVIWDWKTTSGWTVKRMNEAAKAGKLEATQANWWRQLRLMAGIHHLLGAEVQTAKLWVVARDHSPAQARKYKHYPDVPSQAFEYPGGLDPAACAAELQARVQAWKQALETPEPMLDPCAETFGTDWETGLPRRCQSYCSVNDQCSVYRAASFNVARKGR